MFRFTIRDVLLAMVIVGLGVGWWLDHGAGEIRVINCQRVVHSLNTDLEEMLRAIEDSGHVVAVRLGQMKLEKRVP